MLTAGLKKYIRKVIPNNLLIAIQKLLRSRSPLHEASLRKQSSFIRACEQAGLDPLDVSPKAHGSITEGSLVWPHLGAVKLENPLPSQILGDLSIDFWDTLVGRYRPSQSVKLSTALFLSLKMWQLDGFRKNRVTQKALVELRNSFETSVSKGGSDSTLADQIEAMLQGESSHLCHAVQDYEIAAEIRNSGVLSSPLLDLLRPGTKSRIVSDHCLGATNIETILNHCLGWQTGCEIIVSADFGKTKRNGDLFKQFIWSSDWIHIGDNPVSDVQRAKEAGANTILVSREPNSAWNKDVAVSESELALDIRKHLSETAAGDFLVDLTSLAYGIVTGAIEEALGKGKRTVVYVSREGSTLHRAHVVVSKILRELGLETVDSIHLQVSRSSIVACSMSKDLDGFFEILDNEFGPLTIQSFCHNMGLSEELQRLIEGDRIVHKEAPAKILFYSLAEHTQKEIRIYLDLQYDLVQRMLDEQLIDPSNSIIADLGWRATMQTALGKWFDDEFSGFYLGLYPKKDGQPSVEASTLLFDNRRNKRLAPSYLNLPGPLERAFTTLPNQVSGYKEAGGRVEVVYAPDSDGPSAFRKQLMNRFDDVMAQVAKSLFDVGIFGKGSQSFFAQILDNFFLSPNEVHAHAWFGEVHREGFGLTLFNEGHFRISPRGLSPEESLRLTRWPAGWIEYVDSKQIGSIG